jgi:hypothetical protein
MGDNGMPKEEPGDVVKKIHKALSGSGSGKRTKKKNKVIVLMHDIMFRNSLCGRKKL